MVVEGDINNSLERYHYTTKQIGMVLGHICKISMCEENVEFFGNHLSVI